MTTYKSDLSTGMLYSIEEWFSTVSLLLFPFFSLSVLPHPLPPPPPPLPPLISDLSLPPFSLSLPFSRSNYNTAYQHLVTNNPHPSFSLHISVIPSTLFAHLCLDLSFLTEGGGGEREKEEMEVESNLWREKDDNKKDSRREKVGDRRERLKARPTKQEKRQSGGEKKKEREERAAIGSGGS